MQIKSIALSKNQIISLSKFVVLLAIALMAPLLHSQLITGTIVNAVLFLATALLGWQMALTIAVLPSLIAVLWGTLPLPLAPMIPFIITGNGILIIVFYLLKNKNLFLAGMTAAFLKFAFLYLTSLSFTRFILPVKIAPNFIKMMSYPQLITAVIGGIIACSIVYIYENKTKKTN